MPVPETPTSPETGKNVGTCRPKSSQVGTGGWVGKTGLNSEATLPPPG